MTNIKDTSLRKNFFLVQNPNSGSKNPKLFKAVCHLLEESGAHLTVKQTSSFGEGSKASKEAALSGTFDAVIAVGGDGTIQDVATGLLGSSVPMGLVPTGTGNVLARELNYKFSARSIVNTLLNESARPIHAGLANDMPFLFAASVGYDAQVVQDFEKMNGRRLGRAGYALPGIKALFNNTGGDLVVTTDSGTHKANWAIVTRVRFYASDFLLCPDADIANDLFHVVLFTGKSRITRLRQLIGLATKTLPKISSVSFQISKTVKIESDLANTIQIDGEAIGALPLSFKIHPQMLSVIAPNISNSKCT